MSYKLHSATISISEMNNGSIFQNAAFLVHQQKQNNLKFKIETDFLNILTII